MKKYGKTIHKFSKISEIKCYQRKKYVKTLCQNILLKNYLDILSSSSCHHERYIYILIFFVVFIIIFFFSFRNAFDAVALMLQRKSILCALIFFFMRLSLGRSVEMENMLVWLWFRKRVCIYILGKYICEV